MVRTIDITVPVPENRVAVFYRWFADWVSTTQAHATSGDLAIPVQSSIPDAPVEAVAAAQRWWSLLKQSERDLFKLWAREAPRMLTAAVIVKELGLNGPRDIPGILAWPSRKGAKVAFQVKWSFRRDAITREPLYGIEDVDYAAVILDAAARVEDQ